MATATTMLISLVFGIMYLFVFVMDDDLNRLTLYFGILAFMLAMFLITDFSHILIDVKDNYIILPKPVSSQTFLIGRLLHIIIHVSKIIVPMALPGWIGIWISRGLWGAVVFIPVMMLLTILTFAVVNALYHAGVFAGQDQFDHHDHADRVFDCALWQFPAFVKGHGGFIPAGD